MQSLSSTLPCFFPHLILPRTKKNSDGSANKTISRRLEMWSQGWVVELFSESEAHLPRLTKASKNNQNEVRVFNRLMHQGKVSSAIRQLDPDHKDEVLSLSQAIGLSTVLDILKVKRQAASKSDPWNSDVENRDLPYHPSVYKNTSTEKVKQAALKTLGSHGPSGPDADEWRLLTSFDKSSTDLCKNWRVELPPKLYPHII